VQNVSDNSAHQLTKRSFSHEIVMNIMLEILQKNANDESFANTLNIRILQHNCAKSMQIMHACMKFAKNSADIVILQES
jgi:hypothetical protein